MELQRCETTGCLRANTNGSKADHPARWAGPLLQREDERLPACSSALVVLSNKRTRQET
jgi:hypothetical protein